MGIHASVQKRWSVRKRMVTSLHRGEFEATNVPKGHCEGNILKRKFPSNFKNIQRPIISIQHDLWCESIFGLLKTNTSRILTELVFQLILFSNQDTREAWSCCTKRWPPVSMPKRPGGSGIRGGREGTGNSWEGWMTKKCTKINQINQ